MAQCTFISKTALVSNASELLPVSDFKHRPDILRLNPWANQREHSVLLHLHAELCSTIRPNVLGIMESNN